MFPAYELIAVQGGTRLTLSADQDAPDGPDAPLTDPKVDADGFPVLPPGHGALGAHIRGVHAKFQSFTMPELAGRLTDMVTPRDEPTHYVIDKTGLTGRYDFRLKYDDDASAIVFGPAAQSAMPAPDSTAPGSGLPNLFKALEQ